MLISKESDIFIAMIAHELRTPLTSILICCKTLLLDKNQIENKKQSIELIYACTTAQTHLIDDLLNMAECLFDKIHLELQMVALRPVIDNAINVVTPIALNKKIQIQIVMPLLNLAIHADARRLQQVFCNILFNAIKFSPVNSVIYVSSQVINQAEKIEIIDLVI